MQKVRWILGIAFSAIALLLQVIPATSMFNAEGGGLWIAAAVFFAVALVTSVVGLILCEKPVFDRIGRPYRIAHNILLFVPLALVVVRLSIGVADIIARTSEGNPDVFSGVDAILNAGFFILLALAVALPIGGRAKKPLDVDASELTYMRGGVAVKRRMSNRTFRMIVIPVIAVLLVVIIAVTMAANMFGGYLDMALGRGEKHVVTIEGSENCDTDYYGETLTPEEAKKQALEVLNDVTDEGMVLLKNNGVLPLAKGDAVSPFGKGYVFPFFDSPGTDSSMKHSYDYSVYPKEALESKFDVISYAADLQPTTTDGVSTSNGNSSFSEYPDQPEAAPGTKAITDNSFGANGRIPELSVTRYNELTSPQKTEMASSTAIVFISRTGSEGMDLKFDGYTDGTPHYLALSKNEKDMIAKAKELCEQVVVVINAVNAMELAPLMEGELEADAIVLAGLPGEEGFHSLARILCGEVNPSGRTVDIYTRDNLANPVMANYGDYDYENATIYYYGSQVVGDYVEYEEGMYVGYRYYETAHDIGEKDFVYGELDGQGGVSVAGEVTYPFGYGLSYTDFEQSILSFEDKGGELAVEVEVKNVGDVAGKEVVQLYFDPPYTDYDRENGVEKPTATLCAFAKTDIIPAGGSERVSLTIDKEEFTSFVSNRDNGDGTTGCYMLEEGTYEISLRANSHEVIETREYEQGETVFYDNSNPRSYEVEKQAAMADDGTLLNYPEKRAIDEDASFIAATVLFPYMDEYMQKETTMLTRANWDKTVPVYTPRQDYYVAPSKSISQEFVDLFNERMNYDAATNTQIGTNPDSEIYTDVMPVSNQDNGLVVSDLRGKDYYDPMWDDLLDQIDWEADHDAIEEMLLSSNYYTPEIESIGLPRTIHTEGANGIRVGSSKEQQMLTVTWCMCPVMASTWNVELLEDIGAAMAAEALANGSSARYSPAFNLHRSPFSGRNMEYYSEDPFLTGMLVANMINGSSNGGLIEYMKHFTLNDQETNRKTAYTWATEQVVREVYAKPFEMAIRMARKTIQYTADENGTVAEKTMRGAGGMMYSMNAFGPVTSWSNYDLVTELVRNEWNFHGVTNTDWTYAVGENDYSDMVIFAGCDTWLTGNSKMTGGAGFLNFTIKDMESATARTAYREAIHHVAFQIANSGAMQGVAPGSITYYDTSPWVIWLTVANVAAYVFIAGGIVWIVVRAVHEKKHPEQYRKR